MSRTDPEEELVGGAQAGSLRLVPDVEPDDAEPVVARRTQTPIVRGSWERRLVVLDERTHPVQHAGRAAMRRFVLSMTPEDVDVAPRLRSVPGEAEAGVFWGMLDRNGLAVVLRTRDFVAPGEARADAEALLARSGELVAHPVCAPGRRSLWLALDGRVALVAGQVWRRSAPRIDGQVLRTVRLGARWGQLDA